MKKSKLAVGILTSLLCAGTLAGCDSNKVKYSKDGVILTYQIGDEIHKVTADELMGKYYNDSTKYQSIYDSIYSIIVKNYFAKGNEETVKTTDYLNPQNKQVGYPDMEQINKDAQYKVDSDKRTAETNADNNKTSYKKEFNAILESKGCEDEDELFDHYVEELQKEKFDENFYTYHVNELKDGDENVKIDGQQVWNGYFKEMAPYHVAHILVKLEDSGSTNYANGTISEANAEKLHTVVDALKEGRYSFDINAVNYSDDDGSSKEYGNLGIMDYSTGYVNEFKLGVYAYENLLGPNQASVDGSQIEMPETEFDTYAKESYSECADGLPVVNYQVFQDLYDHRKETKDIEGKSVIGDSALVYPRNVIYNKYLNRHSYAFVEGTEDTSAAVDNIYPYSAMHTFADAETDVCGEKLIGRTLLAVNLGTQTEPLWSPVIMARAGTSDYQGIHFIVVIRSPFEGTVEENNDYYTTFYPGQNGYPVTADKEPKTTYVNYSTFNVTKSKEKAESFASTLKSFDSDRLNKYIFLKYFLQQNIEIKDKSLKDSLTRWITSSFSKTEDDKVESWEKTWSDYSDTLSKQNKERGKLVSQACIKLYPYANYTGTVNQLINGDSDDNSHYYSVDFTLSDLNDLLKSSEQLTGNEKVCDLFKKEGGIFNDGTQHL